MPPKKKNLRPSLAVAEDNIADVSEKGTTALSESSADPWTDEQEALLFKSILSWKPVGSFLL